MSNYFIRVCCFSQNCSGDGIPAIAMVTRAILGHRYKAMLGKVMDGNVA